MIKFAVELDCVTLDDVRVVVELVNNVGLETVIEVVFAALDADVLFTNSPTGAKRVLLLIEFSESSRCDADPSFTAKLPSKDIAPIRMRITETT